MGLLGHYRRNELDELRKNGARLRVIGDREGLASDIVRDISDAENMTRGNSRIDVNICINYGARAEILQAIRSLARQVAAGELSADRIDEDCFESELLTSGVPDPDLLIRTSGEQRISNFMLWQCAYAELVFVDTLWPDFGKEHLEQAIAEFRRRERRYGGVGGCRPSGAARAGSGPASAHPCGPSPRPRSSRRRLAPLPLVRAR